MGKKTKIGKQRRDKYYRLAKETGFRSRAAFKLLQLNRKFEFLEKSRVLIDLCASPGGWMQVAQQNMPVSSLIIGVDLYPIKPIPGCISLVEDITTDKCRVALSKALQTWKADIVLNDGAPNVGTNWVLDAYQQACLTLSALKIATEFLREGGWFITKIFRSKDYNSVLWVLKQLFKRVHATKPQASRNESAEIFVVCQNYKAPDKLDPKFLQAKYVFKDLELGTSNSLNVFHPNKQKKPKAEGYQENNNFHSVKVSDFIKSNNAIEVLQRASEIVIDDEEILNHPKTTNEIKECFKDIRLLNRKDVRAILAWWKTLKELKAKEENEKQLEDKETNDEAEINLSDEEEKEMDEIDRHIAKLKKEELREQKRKKKSAEKERKKLEEKMNLKMIVQNGEDPKLNEDSAMFSLSLIKSKKELNQISEQTPDVVAESEEESDEDALPKAKKIKIDKENTHLDSSGKFYKGDSELESSDEEKSLDSNKEGLAFEDSENEEEDQSSSPQIVKKNKNPLLTDLDYRVRKEKRLSKVALWFEKENLKNLQTEVDEDYDLDVLSNDLKKMGKKILEGHKENKDESKKTNEKNNNKVDKSDPNVDIASNSESSDSDYDCNSDLQESQKKNLKKKKVGSNKENSYEVTPAAKVDKKRKLNEEGLALGTLIASSKKKKRDLIDSAWNRYAFNDENLPDWFVQDEKEHMSQVIPVPTELVEEYKDKLKEINTKSIKKVVQAKARKKRRMLKRLEKAKKKVEAIVDNMDISEREKIRNINKLYKKAKATRKKEVTYIVSKKHTAAKRVRRPPGVKGHYKVVDPRMKKDLKHLKNKTKNGKKKKESKRSKTKRKVKESKRSKK